MLVVLVGYLSVPTDEHTGSEDHLGCCVDPSLSFLLFLLEHNDEDERRLTLLVSIVVGFLVDSLIVFLVAFLVAFLIGFVIDLIQFRVV